MSCCPSSLPPCVFQRSVHLFIHSLARTVALFSTRCDGPLRASLPRATPLTPRPRRHAVTAGRPFPTALRFTDKQTKDKEGEKDDRSASCPVCSLRRAVRCGGTCQHHRRGRRDPGGADERDERCLRVRPEQSAERRLRELGVALPGCEQSAIHRQLHGESDQRWTEEGSGCDRARAGRRQPACRLGGGRR
ncbi:hypothetical protein ERJ75_000106100 [Trypanosoma vivax]|nr:hypothetical protein ERJ75_000106100 [Trypanosoma vivax]